MNVSAGPRVIVGYDGSPAATAAIDVGTALLPRARASITYLWTPPYSDEGIRARLWISSRRLDEFVDALEREGEWQAGRVAAHGVTLARAAGWDAEPLLRRAQGGESLQLAELTERLKPNLVLVGSRGLTGARAILGSVSDMVVHYTPGPLLVVSYPLLSAEYAALAAGPVLVGWDGSAGATAALAGAGVLFPDRELLAVHVGSPDGHEARAELPRTAGRPPTVLRVDSRHGGSARGVANSLAVCARERQAALVVVGSRGRSAVQEILLGSVAMATLHHTYRPVMVVPRVARKRP